jgi:hypothetical protein
MVPWLVLFGRCCMMIVHPVFFVCFIILPKSPFKNWFFALQSWLQGSSTSAQLAAAGLNPGALLQALQDASTALQRLQDKGIGVHARDGPSTDVQQQQQDQGSVAATAPLYSDGGEDGHEFAVRLHALGLLLSSLPLSWGCNFYLCLSMQGPTEAGIVQGKAHKCSRCGMAYYCSKQCQAQHWQEHKPVCKAVAAAGAAGARP